LEHRTQERVVVKHGYRLWTPQEDAILREEYAHGEGWEERAVERLPGRTFNGILWRSALVHLRPSGWMRKQRRRAEREQSS
jgi:hypothetical protein